jgi:hypothetical protein
VAGGGYGYLAAADSHLVSAEWIDSTPNAYNLSGGFQYLYATEPGNAFESYSLGAAFTFQFGGTFLSVGTAWHWLFDLRERYSQVRFASHLTPDGRSERGLSGWTEDFGFVANFGNQLLVGAAGYNLVQGTDLDLPRGTGGGISWWSGPIMLSADVSSEFGVPVEDGKEEDRIAYMGAFQFMATHGIYLRGGMSRDEPVGQTRLAGGLGIVGGSIGIEVGYQHNLTDTRDYIVAAGLQIYDPFGPGQGLQ